MSSFSNLTFVSITGPRLDDVHAKSIRAHTTKANFARRRQRLVQKYTLQKKSQIDFYGDLSLERKDTLFINHLAQAMENLHLVTNIPKSEAAIAVIQSDWARFLTDPAMLDVSLYFGRHLYAARRHSHEAQFSTDAYKGKAIQSVRERLGNDNLSDGLVAAILVLTILDQVSGNIDAWKIHISGLFQIVRIRSQNSNHLPPHWILNIMPRTILQGLLLFSRQDMELLPTIMSLGIFDALFSAPAQNATYCILANAEQMIKLHHYSRKTLLVNQQLHIGRIIQSLDAAIQINSKSHRSEQFLSAIALSMKIFLQIVQRDIPNTEGDLKITADQLMEVLELPEQQLPSSLALCSSLELVFWQTTMGAIAAPEGKIRSFYTSRLERICLALDLTSWYDASTILEKFFWIPALFAAAGQQILSQILYSHRGTKDPEPSVALNA